MWALTVTTVLYLFLSLLLPEPEPTQPIAQEQWAGQNFVQSDCRKISLSIIARIQITRAYSVSCPLRGVANVL